MTRPDPGVPRVLGRVVLGYPRAGPVTCGFLLVLGAGHLWLARSADAGPVLGRISTNLDNLHRHPVGSLVGSALVVDGPLVPAPDRAFGGTLITVGLGIAVAGWWWEAHHGAVRAALVFVAGHVGATLLTACVVAAAIAAGRYPAGLRTAPDYGISYGAQALLGALTAALPRRARLPWLVGVLGWPLAGARWYGPLPDFTTIGHLLGAVIGTVVGVLLVRSGPDRRRPGSAGGPAPGGGAQQS